MKMRLQPETVWKVGIILMLLANLYGAFPYFNYAPYQPANPDDVRVYEPDKGSQKSIATDIPVQRLDANQPVNPFVDTGARVTVWLRCAARDWESRRIPSLTLGILLVTWTCAWICRRMKGKPNQASEGMPRKLGNPQG